MCRYENIVKKSQRETKNVELINNFTVHMDVNGCYNHHLANQEF